MSILGQGIRKVGMAIREARAKRRGEFREIIDVEKRLMLKMYIKGYSMEEIADVAGKSVEEVRAFLE